MVKPSKIFELKNVFSFSEPESEFVQHSESHKSTNAESWPTRELIKFMLKSIPLGWSSIEKKRYFLTHPPSLLKSANAIKNQF